MEDIEKEGANMDQDKIASYQSRFDELYPNSPDDLESRFPFPLKFTITSEDSENKDESQPNYSLQNDAEANQ